MWLDRFYKSRERWDDKLFRDECLRQVTGKVVLDIGAGAGIVPETDFRGIAAKVIGIDLDHRVLTNPFLNEAYVASATHIPLADASVDVVICDNVLEHLVCPIHVFRDICRVLKPGGIFIAKTPNKWHYMPVIARITPMRFHRWFNELRGRKCDDTFPTVYKANSEADIRRLSEHSGFAVHSIQHIEGRPEYLRFSTITYLVGIAYERLVNCHEMFRRFRIVLLMTLHRR
jgi:SAM-dependent methyltransferase